MPGIDELAKTVLAARRKRFLFSRPVFRQLAAVSENELLHLAMRLDFKFVTELSRWLLVAGYCEIDDAIIFREDSFSIIDWKPLQGFVAFAESDTGVQFAFDPKDGGIYSIHPAEHAFVCLADNFSSFLQELIRHDYHVNEWMNSLSFSTGHVE